jgi:positive regulator of sigma E activity
MYSTLQNLLFIGMPIGIAEWLVLIVALIVWLLPVLLLAWLIRYLIRKPYKNNER